MNITTDQIQLLTLLSTIIAIMAGMLSITEHFKKNGVLQSVFAIMLCILPVLFIQQILVLTTILEGVVNHLAVGYAVIIIVVLCVRTKKEEIPSEIKIIIFGIFTSSLLLLTNPLFHANEVYNMKSFMEKLVAYKISTEMFSFLAGNIVTTIGIFCNFIQIIITIYFVLQLLLWFASLFASNLKFSITYQKAVYLTILTCLLAFGVHWYIEEYIFSLFY